MGYIGEGAFNYSNIQNIDFTGSNAITYIGDGAFYRNRLKRIIDKLNYKIEDCKVCDNLSLTPDDILLKRDIDYINKLVLEKKYDEHYKPWKDFTREEKCLLLMKYIEDISLTYDSRKRIHIENINFRTSMCTKVNDLYDEGYIDKTDFGLIGGIVSKIRFSEYRPMEEVENHILRLRDYYLILIRKK